MSPARAIIALIGLLLITTNTCNSAPSKCTCEDLVISPSDQSCLLGHLLQIITHLINNQQKPICAKGLIQNPNNSTFVSSPASATTQPPSDITTSPSEFDVRDLDLTTSAPSDSPTTVLDLDLPSPTTQPPSPQTEFQGDITTVLPPDSQSEDFPVDSRALDLEQSPPTDSPSDLLAVSSTTRIPTMQPTTEASDITTVSPSDSILTESPSDVREMDPLITNLSTTTTESPRAITTLRPSAEDVLSGVSDLELQSQTTQSSSPLTGRPQSQTTESPRNITTVPPSGTTSNDFPFETRDLEVPETNQDPTTDQSSGTEIEQPVNAPSGSTSPSETFSYESGENSEPGTKSIEGKTGNSAPASNSTTLGTDQKCMKPQTLFIPVLHFGNCLTPEKLQEYLYNIFLNPEHTDIKS
ncbi:unnamed protein product [Phaedon cochleariae]|uniref:Uncharacterized protein n=1 Tax=Phaedon cochleariae TaxID=80249 RepID=A0A9P0D974_PHACE|nr:unnamed protein product [Phaedon cochleariae]